MDGETYEVICNKCRAAVPSDADVCPHCGAVLFVRAVPPSATPPNSLVEQSNERRGLLSRVWRRAPKAADEERAASRRVKPS